MFYNEKLGGLKQSIQTSVKKYSSLFIPNLFYGVAKGCDLLVLITPLFLLVPTSLAFQGVAVKGRWWVRREFEGAFLSFWCCYIIAPVPLVGLTSNYGLCFSFMECVCVHVPV